MAKATYKDAGVDLELYEQAMQRLPRWMHRTRCPRVIDLPQGFAGLFRLDMPGGLFARRYKNPVLVSCTDGVGTKLKVAAAMGKYDTVGIDLVAMSVNDALCCGAEPLFFLDYVAMPKDDPVKLEQLVRGISEGCLQADCSLLGGETAILPDLYAPDDFDLAGFCVGVVEADEIIDGKGMVPGDVVLGLASSGLHSNGYSLARKVVFDIAGLTVESPVEELGCTAGEALLEPTRIYVKPIRSVLRHYRVKKVVHGIAHITGGGIDDNLGRIVPKNVRVELRRGSWPVPPVFTWLQRLGEIDDAEMAHVFNMGIGMVLVVSSYYAGSIIQQLAKHDIPAFEIGQVVEGDGDITWID
ncbi:MAG: phosphoribosylformylglycinamidine cyclo-ligase [Planctomycetota bacterium]|nr:MAG: phosphoribosylformylglycinamidine cyclo-ligase [Planctomycetota bacterium]